MKLTSALILFSIILFKQCYAQDGLKNNDSIKAAYLTDSITASWMRLEKEQINSEIKIHFISYLNGLNDNGHKLADSIFLKISSGANTYNKVMLLSRLADYYLSINETEKYLKAIDQAIQITQQSGDTQTLVQFNRAKAFTLYKNLKINDHEALILLLDALELQNPYGDNEMETIILKDLAEYHYTFGDETRAFHLYKQVITKSNSLSLNGPIIIDSWNAIGLLHRNNTAYDSALHYFTIALNLAKKNKMIVWIDIINGNIGDTYYYMGKYAEAIPLLERDLETCLQKNITSNLSKIYYNLGASYLKINDQDKAGHYLQRAVNSAIINKEFAIVASSYEALADSELQKGNSLNAIKFYRRSISLKDSLNGYTLVKAKQKQEIDRIYNLREKEKQQLFLTKVNQDQEVVIGRQKIISRMIFSIAFIASVVTVSLIILVRKRRRFSEKIDQQFRIIKSQKSEIEKFNQNLEREVELRTAELNSINKELREYAFLNAHKVRGPLARMLGLFYLWENNFLQEDEKSKFIELLVKEAKTMDDEINSISMKLESMSVKELNH